MTIQRIEALDPESQLPLEGEALTRAFPEGFPAKAVVPGVQSTAVLFAFSVDRVPASLTHHSRFQMGDNPEPLTVERPGTPVRLNTLHIHPPLSGANWLALNGPRGNHHHTGGLMPYQGRVHVPQRFAIDFVQLEPSGGTHHGDAKDNRQLPPLRRAGTVRGGSHRARGARRHPRECARPRKAGRRDDPRHRQRQSHRARSRTRPVPPYAHFQPGSSRAHKGDRVRVGQQLGLVGNSGNSAEPHLHSQITDGPEILGSDGLPYELVTFVHDGKRVRNELPRNRWVIDF